MKTTTTTTTTTSLLVREEENLSLGTKLISRDSSSAGSYSRRDYYGGSAAVPFQWESIPGTPKHRLAVEPDVPPITPPPSAHPKTASVSENPNSRPSLLLLHSIFHSIRRRSKLSLSSSSYSSSSTSSSSSSSPHSAMPCSTAATLLSFSPPSSGFCFGIRKQRGGSAPPPPPPGETTDCKRRTMREAMYAMLVGHVTHK